MCVWWHGRQVFINNKKLVFQKFVLEGTFFHHFYYYDCVEKIKSLMIRTAATISVGLT